MDPLTRENCGYYDASRKAPFKARGAKMACLDQRGRIAPGLGESKLPGDCLQPCYQRTAQLLSQLTHSGTTAIHQQDALRCFGRHLCIQRSSLIGHFPRSGSTACRHLCVDDLISYRNKALLLVTRTSPWSSGDHGSLDKAPYIGKMHSRRPSESSKSCFHAPAKTSWYQRWI